MSNQDIAPLFKALADDNRIAIVQSIARMPGITANQLLQRLDIAQSTLSHHMRVLSEASLVRVMRQGKWSHYSMNPEAIDELERFVNTLRSDGSHKARRLRFLLDLRNDIGSDERLLEALKVLISGLTE